jgi:hypothetical protein
MPCSEIVLVAVASGMGSAGFRVVVLRMKRVELSGPESPSDACAIGLKNATRTPLRSKAFTRPRATVVKPTPVPAGARKNACFMSMIRARHFLTVTDTPQVGHLQASTIRD